MKASHLNQAAEVLVVALARTGDREAFAELVNRHQSWIRGLFGRLGAEPALLDDLAQQTFLQAWKDISGLRDPNKFSGWLKQIAINVWRGYWRRQGGGNMLVLQDEFDAELAIETLSATDSNLNRDLQSALSTLPIEVSTCIVLAYHEGMSQDEVAVALDIPLGTVKSHIRRGSKKLRELLQDYIEQDKGNPNA
ncbi:MAG: sigma-70 family RNA polymerase sigma factor [Pseudomonadota bacterium]